ILATIAPGANAAATIARFCSTLHDRPRSGPVMICILAISMSLALVQAPTLAPVRTSGLNCPPGARRPSPEGYADSGLTRFAERGKTMPIVYTGRRKPTVILAADGSVTNEPAMSRSASYASGGDNTARRSRDYQLGVVDSGPLIEPLP